MNLSAFYRNLVININNKYTITEILRIPNITDLKLHSQGNKSLNISQPFFP